MSKVISIDKFKEVEVGDISDEENMKDMLLAVLGEGCTTVIVVGIADNGEGVLAHTPLESRLHTMGVLTTMQHWLFKNGLDTGDLD